MFENKLHQALFEGLENQQYISPGLATKLRTDSGWYTYDPDTGEWGHQDGMVASESAVQYLDGTLSAGQKSNRQRVQTLKKTRYGAADNYGTIDDPDLENAPEGLLPWEVEYLKILKNFVEDNEISGRALTAREAGLKAPEFATPDDLYMILDPGGDYIVVSSGRTRKNRKNWTHGNGTYVFRKTAPAPTSHGEVIIDGGEPFTSYIDKLKLGIQPDPESAAIPRAKKLVMRDQAKTNNLGIMLRRDKHYRHIEDILKPSQTFDRIREHVKNTPGADLI